MKKITILALHLGYGGVEKSISSLANLLSLNEEYKVKIVSIYKLYDKPVFTLNDNIEVVYLLNEKYKPNREQWHQALTKLKLITLIEESFKSIKILINKRKKVIEYLKNNDDDVIISTRIFLNELVGEYINQNTKKIGWEHNHHHGDLKYATDVTRSAKNLDYLVLVSKDLQKFYKKQLKKYKTKTKYIPNVIEKMPKRKSPLTKEHLITVGRLAPEKGYLDLLNIYNELKRKGYNWHLDIIGDGPMRKQLEEYIEKNNLENDVTLHGFKTSEEIEKLMKNASIYLMSSYTESFGIVLIEAMSNGLPCIAFDSAEGAREIITSGHDGYLIKNRNFTAMEKKIIDLMTDYDKRCELGKNGKNKVKKYLPDSIKNSWEKIIN